MQNAFSDALFDLEDESLGAGQLVAVHAVANEFQFVVLDALFDELAISSLPPLLWSAR
jgi:hypothetical protein